MAIVRSNIAICLAGFAWLLLMLGKTVLAVAVCAGGES